MRVQPHWITWTFVTTVAASVSAQWRTSAAINSSGRLPVPLRCRSAMQAAPPATRHHARARAVQHALRHAGVCSQRLREGLLGRGHVLQVPADGPPVPAVDAGEFPRGRGVSPGLRGLPWLCWPGLNGRACGRPTGTCWPGLNGSSCGRSICTRLPAVAAAGAAAAAAVERGGRRVAPMGRWGLHPLAALHVAGSPLRRSRMGLLGQRCTVCTRHMSGGGRGFAASC